MATTLHNLYEQAVLILINDFVAIQTPAVLATVAHSVRAGGLGQL